jgi:hypothetical protein
MDDVKYRERFSTIGYTIVDIQSQHKSSEPQDREAAREDTVIPDRGSDTIERNGLNTGKRQRGKSTHPCG